MRKNRFYDIYLILSLLFLIPSCDSLDLNPINVINEEDSFGNESAILAQFTTFYSNMEIEAFDFCSEGKANARLEYYTGYAVARYNDDIVDESGKSQFINGAMGGEWLNYGIIRQINEFLIKIDTYASNFSAEQIKYWKNEARVIRAVYYFSIAQRYGGMPIITEPQEVDVEHPENMMVARSSEKEIWDFIISEIDEALKDNGLPENPEMEGRIDKYTALAYKARAALYAASIAKYNSPKEGIGNYVDPDTGKQICGIPASEANNYYTIAFNAAKDIIISGKYQLARGLSQKGEDNFALLFQDPSKHNEDIFVEKFQYPAVVHWWDYYHLPAPWGQSWYDNPTLDLVNMYDNLDGTPVELKQYDSWTPEKPTCDYYFKNRDYRMGGTVYYPGGPFPVGDGIFDLRRGLLEEGMVHSGTGQKELYGKIYNIRGKYGMGEWLETQTGFLCRKYVKEANIEQVSSTMPSEQTWIEIRYAEVLLIAAEAAAELGVDNNNVGLDAINDIRNRAGLQNVSALSIDEVRKQWVCEMAFENKLFWCMRRWRTLDQSLTNNFQSKGVQPFFGPNFYNRGEDIWKILVVNTGRYPKVSFQDRYYYGWINTGVIATNPLIKQNYGY